MSIAETNDAYRKAVLSRQALENEVGTVGHALRVLESDLRKAREAERKALLEYSAAVERSGG